MSTITGFGLRERAAVVALVAAESASVAYATVLLVSRTRLARFLKDNAASVQFRMVLVLATCAAALAAAGLLAIKTRDVAAFERVRRWGYRLAPLLLAWCVPGLASRSAFEGRALALLLLLAAAVTALEATGRRSFAEWSFPWKAKPAIAYACVGVMVIAYVTFASRASIRLHHRLFTSLFDLGMFENLFWNTLHGVHGVAANGRYFGEHAEFILYPLLPVYALFPRTETLLILQSMFLGGSSVPLYLLSKRWLDSAWQPLLLVGAFLLFPAVHGPNFYDFHFLTLSVFFVLWAAYFFVCERWVAFWAAVLLALACREDVSIGAAAIGASLVIAGRHPRVGAALAALAIAWFVSIKLYWMRSIGGDAFIEYYADLVPGKPRGFRGVLSTLLSNPLFVLTAVASKEKLILLLHLLVPLAFLPVRRPENLFLFLPGLLVVGLTTGSSMLSTINFQYVSHFVPYVFVACAASLANLEGPRRAAALFAIAFGSVIATTHFGAIGRNRYNVSFHEVSFSWSETDEERLAALRSLAGQIPPDARVAAGDAEGAHVARRHHIGGIKEGVGDAEYVLYGQPVLRWGGADQIVKILESGEFGVVGSRGEFVLLARGASPAANKAQRERLH